MSSHAAATPSTVPTWSVEMFEAFWSNPDPSAIPPEILTEDVVGYWAGLEEPVRGRSAYLACIAAAVEALPSLRLAVAETASEGDFTFIRWTMSATGEYGPFELTGVDRVRVRDGRVAENMIIFDTAAFEARAGFKPPWV